MHLSPSELRAIVAGGEGRTTELKRGVQRDETLARTIAAFANTRGGMLLIGVSDKGVILGAPRARETMERLVGIARTSVDPPVAVETVLVTLEERPVVCCSVPLSAARPHSAVGAGGERTVLVRAGSSNRVASERDLAGMKPAPAAPSALEAQVLAWMEEQDHARTAREFARECGVGIQRCRGAFLALERAGLLVGHGQGDQRAFERPK
jgi:predicted HTH transcriptional regulator